MVPKSVSKISGRGPSSPPWHPCPGMELATVPPRAQPMTRRSMQKAMSYIVLAHRPPCGWPTIYAIAVLVMTVFQKAVDAF